MGSKRMMEMMPLLIAMEVKLVDGYSGIDAYDAWNGHGLMVLAMKVPKALVMALNKSLWNLLIRLDPIAMAVGAQYEWSCHAMRIESDTLWFSN
ncbi:hypothetical protein Tco_0318448 [Tanacetum coccineum]